MISHFWPPRANPAPFWGTCGVCEGTFKIAGGVTSKHGFTRPGVGYLIGACFGQEKRPWETSPESAEQFVRQVLYPELVKAEKTLARYEAGEVHSLDRAIEQTLLQRRHKEAVQFETLTPEHKDWERVFKTCQHMASNRVRDIKRDISHYEKRLSTWAPKPLHPVDPSHPTSKKDKVFKVVEKFKAVEEDAGPDLSKPVMQYAPGDDPWTAGASTRMVPVPGRFWTKYVKRKIPYYDAVDATSGRKVATGKTREEAIAGALRKGHRPA